MLIQMIFPITLRNHAMQRSCFIKSTLTLLALYPLLTSCGSKDESDPPPVVVYGKTEITSVSGKDNASLELTSLTQCARNADTGRVDISVSQGPGKPGLTLAIKDYSSSAKTYTCTQAADNQGSETSVGGKFESCMVGVSVLSAATATTLNGYSMYRETTTTKPFAYTGVCTIQVTDASPSIKATVSCTKMIQTQLEGAPRNPIDANVTADLTADINCTFQ
jgi:hypothetical protein